jgi:hypothetical protein
VLLTTWQRGDRSYYELTGPILPTATTQDMPLEAVYRVGSGVRIERYGLHRAQIVWRTGSLVSGSALLPPHRYRAQSFAGGIRIVFWTSRSEPVGNLIYRYREGSETASVSLDRDKGTDPYDPAQWNSWNRTNSTP